MTSHDTKISRLKLRFSNPLSIKWIFLTTSKLSDPFLENKYRGKVFFNSSQTKGVINRSMGGLI